MARAAAAKATSSGSKSKTAVVVIHGIGEQRPLGTIKEFVETVYRRDRLLATKPLGESGMLEVPIVPDSSTGSSELRRLTTLDDGPAKRTDFFELYWADIMDGTPVEMVTGWIQTLLLRSPWRLPKAKKVQRAWLALWGAVGVILVSGVVALLAGPLEEWPPVRGALTWFADARTWLSLVIVAVALGVLLRNAHRAGWVMREVKLAGPFWGSVAGIVLAVVPPELAASLRFWAGAFTAGVTWMIGAVITPYAGDVVRYVRATPSTVERRRQVRERGVALLEALHAKRLDGDSQKDFTQADADQPPLYDRVVIVGHSLGSIIAYDLVQLFWERHGPTHHQQWIAETDAVQKALKEVDAHVQIAWGPTPQLFDPVDYEAAQTKLFEVLRAERPHWRISDLITLGSPLAHAEFLLADSEEEVETAFVERRFAACPPRPDPMRKGSMLFPPRGPRGPLYPHFAAQFAAVKWTNLYDESQNPLLGDLISGALGGSYGIGIREQGIEIRRPSVAPWRQRIFTHTQYWHWDARYEPTAADIDAAAKASTLEERRELLWANLPKHIRELRLALRLGT